MGWARASQEGFNSDAARVASFLAVKYLIGLR